MVKYLIVLGNNTSEVDKVKKEEFAEFLFDQLKPTNAKSLTDALNNFSRGEVGVLSYLVFDKSEASAGELSEKLNVSTARIASILNSLENKEYITRKIDDFDKRKTLVVITEKGKNLAISTKKEITNMLFKIIDEVGYDDIKEYIRILKKIRNVIDKQ